MFDSPTFYTSPFSYMDNTLSYELDELALNFKQDDLFSLASTYYHLPSPLIYNEVDSYRDLVSATIADDASIFEETNMMTESNKGEETIIQALEEGHEMKKNMVRKVRPSKKDRHSKIKTARGLRDRRMRLSLEVAAPLFELQDMLGYDKASSTIKWLLLKSKDAIDEVFRSKRDASEVTKCSNLSNSISASDCEVESIFVVENQGTSKDNTHKRRLELSSNDSVVRENKNKKMIRKTTTKELRNEARARARLRTLEGSMQGSKGSLKYHQVDAWIDGGNLELISTNGGTYSN